MAEHGLSIDHTTIYRWVQHYAPELKKRLDWCKKRYSSRQHQQIKYRNNRLESDHGKLKRLIHPVLGFQSMKTAYATFKGFEIMRMFKKGKFNIWMYGNRNEVTFIKQLFHLYN